MKTGMTREDLAVEIEKQAKAKADYLVPSRRLQFTLRPESQSEPDVLNKVVLQAVGDNGSLEFPIRPQAHRQFGTHLKVPAQYYDRMLAEAPGLLVESLNTWLGKADRSETRMIRTLHGECRAFLSDRYRPLDNFDLIKAVMPALRESGAQLVSCNVSETKLYLKLVEPSRRAEIPPPGVKDWEWGKDHHAIDVVEPGLVLSNSETGHGSVSVQPACHTRRCSNLAVFAEDKMRRAHLQGAIDRPEGDGLHRYLTDETKRTADAAVWMQVRDLAKAALTGDLFDLTVERLRAARQEVIDRPLKEIVEVTAKRFELSDQEGDSVLRFLGEGGDYTRYGISAAITRASQEVDNYDRATELEQAGAGVIELPDRDWQTLIAA